LCLPFLELPIAGQPRGVAPTRLAARDAETDQPMLVLGQRAQAVSGAKMLQIRRVAAASGDAEVAARASDGIDLIGRLIVI